MMIPALLALAVRSVDISILVGWAFALAASTFCPLFVLGIWWPRLTARGAALGILVGGVVAIGAIAAGVVVGSQTLGGPLDSILTQPAIVSVPLAFAAMVVGSLLTATRSSAAPQMLALHAPEGWASKRSIACAPNSARSSARRACVAPSERTAPRCQRENSRRFSTACRGT